MWWNSRLKAHSGPQECLYGRIRISTAALTTAVLRGPSGEFVRWLSAEDAYEVIVRAYNTSDERAESTNLVYLLRAFAYEVNKVADGIEEFHSKPFPQLGGS